jgi:hypothetical protein
MLRPWILPYLYLTYLTINGIIICSMIYKKYNLISAPDDFLRRATKVTRVFQVQNKGI